MVHAEELDSLRWFNWEEKMRRPVVSSSNQRRGLPWWGESHHVPRDIENWISIRCKEPTCLSYTGFAWNSASCPSSDENKQPWKATSPRLAEVHKQQQTGDQEGELRPWGWITLDYSESSPSWGPRNPLYSFFWFGDLEEYCDDTALKNHRGFWY